MIPSKMALPFCLAAWRTKSDALLAEMIIDDVWLIRKINSPWGFPKKCAKLANPCAADLINSDRM
jgi:hypothetical protein